uniref:Transmembrane protein 11 n=1 Tax=Clastoptera arizonana TaxID=38151 RepID=A0A1B6CYV5_9HEMI
MSLKNDRDDNMTDIAIIREVYDGENSHEVFGEELERALEACCKLIVIEPSRLGDETARWIAVGNCLHKTAVLSGVSAIAMGLVVAQRPLSYMPLAVTSLFCTGLYTVSWQFDPCVQYQVNTDSQTLAKLPQFSTLTTTSVVVLQRKNDKRRKILHYCVTLASTVFCIWKCYVCCTK